jgi:diguanylate cyclase (GGDEF)-like protein
MTADLLSPPALRATGISFAAVVVAVMGATLAPTAPEHEILLWVLAVIPAFLLAYHRGWEGIAAVLAAIMVGLLLVHLIAGWVGVDLVAGGPVLRILLVVLGTTAGVGILAERLHRARGLADRLEITDPETGLPNGRHATLVLERELAGAARGRSLAVVAFRIDGVARHQMRNGLESGAAIRTTFAGVLRKHTRRMNFVARDGDRFLAVLSGGDEEGATVFVRKVQSAFGLAVGPAHALNVSAGIAVCDASMAGPGALVRAADFALFQAQQDGAGTIRVHRARNQVRDAGHLVSSMRGLKEKPL